ncbi:MULTISPECIES: DUF3617 domain-containing protein [unclassified Caulobacter]|uniref:DUF3617 domain-containing protein n=1 Tax=unclassified Caulobacter TaxID=2648921 RepID=UPI000D3ABDE4|nr:MULTISPECIES: DUF3617 family protein [unclassified Caulobacter]PTS91168.1 hypothetical protein DBR21_02125 [Caulobacter sp. HMWF009]PTT11903.1 hypothetical protein DBR10_02685 [Caulobacter sp. HMWF025]PTT75356.1 hypothetical protein DBR41_26385 [Pseudomonas sp. HMWF010]
MRLLVPVAATVATACALLAAGAALALAPPQDADTKAPTTILTGHWEYNTRVGPIPVDSDRRCLTQKDVENFNRGICLKRYSCAYDTRVVRDGRILLKGVWTDKKGRTAPVTAKGSYTPESFRLDVSGRTVNGLPMAATLNARRISPTCPSPGK